jgi:hypothetical protein
MKHPTELVLINACPTEIKTMLDYRYSQGWVLDRIIETKDQMLLIYLFKESHIHKDQPRIVAHH